MPIPYYGAPRLQNVLTKYKEKISKDAVDEFKAGLAKNSAASDAPMVLTPALAAAVREYSSPIDLSAQPQPGKSKLYFPGDDDIAQGQAVLPAAAARAATEATAATPAPAPVIQSTELVGPRPSYNYDSYSAPYPSPYGLVVSPPAAPVTSGVGPDWKTYAVPAAVGVGLVLLAILGIEMARGPSQQRNPTPPSVRRIIASGRYRWTDAVAHGDRGELEDVLGQIQGYAARPITRTKAGEMREVLAALGYGDEARRAFRAGVAAK